ncbi:MAG TPA: 16S rRNA (adenine(1518)-N(6)/adenine(1519)-N(6))-dimethyltransferase RsmA [Candidatus Baltobacteraceae bacterium]|nr:16S rRNA (adenine(1518)-N(6)/adenine(1519)-N(6))-dimethyltransferase RsmA [Candidatus Baltobacteraceae bacterium]
MAATDYKSIIKNMGYSKRLSQNFLLNTEIAQSEAEYARGRDVLELGPGLGILTASLLKVAKSVTSVEKDTRMFEYLSDNLKSKKLTLINSDFFDVKGGQLGNMDIMVSNIPYNLSSKVIMWLSEKNMPAVLCMQKEFVDRMLAVPGTREYSKLSVISALQFKVTSIFDVSPESFYPEPEVMSTVAYLKPKGNGIREEVRGIIGAIMSHKKKRIRNALVDCAKQLDLSKDAALEIAGSFGDPEMRPFQMEPMMIFEVAESLYASQNP